MSKYNLTDLYKSVMKEGMSDDEFRDAQEADRLSKNPKRDKIAKIRAMMAKEKSMKENYQMDGEVYDRIDGSINNELKRKFMFAFEDLFDDMVEAGEEFDKDDILDYLTIQIDKTLREGYSNQDGDRDDSPTEKETEKMRYKEELQPGDIEDDAAEMESDMMRKLKEGPKHADGTPKSNDEMTDDEREQYYLDVDDISLDEDARTDAEEEGYKDGMRDEKADLDENARTDAEEEGYKDGMKDEKEDIEDKKLKEHFQRFLKDYQ